MIIVGGGLLKHFKIKIRVQFRYSSRTGSDVPGAGVKSSK